MGVCESYELCKERSAEEMDQFLVCLSIESFGEQHNVAVLGDLNARFGNEVVVNVVVVCLCMVRERIFQEKRCP